MRKAWPWWVTAIAGLTAVVLFLWAGKAFLAYALKDETWRPVPVVVDGMTVPEGGHLIGRHEVPGVYVETLTQTLGAQFETVDRAVYLITMNDRRILVTYADNPPQQRDVWIKGFVGRFGGKEDITGPDLEALIAAAYPGGRVTHDKDRIYIETKGQ